MEMLASWSKTKTIRELIDEAFWLRTALTRYLARECKQPEFKEQISLTIELLMDMHVSSVAVSSGEESEVEAKNQQGEKILRTIKSNLAYAGIDIERLIAECKRDNPPKAKAEAIAAVGKDLDPWN